MSPEGSGAKPMRGEPPDTQRRVAASSTEAFKSTAQKEKRTRELEDGDDEFSDDSHNGRKRHDRVRRSMPLHQHGPQPILPKPVEELQPQPPGHRIGGKERMVIHGLLQRVWQKWESLIAVRRQCQLEGAARKIAFVQSAKGEHHPRLDITESETGPSPRTWEFPDGPGALQSYREMILQQTQYVRTYMDNSLDYDITKRRQDYAFQPNPDAVHFNRVMVQYEERMLRRNIEIAFYRNPGSKDNAAQPDSLQSTRVRAFREAMEHSKTPIMQVFIPDVGTLGTLSLVSLKGNYPFSILEVESEDLKKLGWWFDLQKMTYWRYELHADASEDVDSPQQTVFRVSIDGDVWSMLTSSGKWLDWSTVIKSTEPDTDGYVGDPEGGPGHPLRHCMPICSKIWTRP
ncbi:hypothetical protein B0T10DRAFT_495106 [Thelonectria olida]|uniref:Uncharacterized protein n=1 Tax=Thelonectria olida TaxID=1576542 RepID=A0A9P8VVN7_9HYPO|nr:hypothetical protein B0T10DRAFT_495106 [Thelonectria olida]